MKEYKLDEQKSITSLLYICQSLGGAWDKYSLLKILYFAECKHLMKYGRPITGDSMIAMEYGPVPSFSYDNVKKTSSNAKYFEVDDTVIKALVKPNMDLLAESEVECLDESIKENCGLAFGALKKKSHDAAYDEARAQGGLNSTISYLSIAKAAGAGKDLLNYISEKVELNSWE